MMNVQKALILTIDDESLRDGRRRVLEKPGDTLPAAGEAVDSQHNRFVYKNRLE
jgi:hypothetical protein